MRRHKFQERREPLDVTHQQICIAYTRKGEIGKSHTILCTQKYIRDNNETVKRQATRQSAVATTIRGCYLVAPTSGSYEQQADWANIHMLPAPARNQHSLYSQQHRIHSAILESILLLSISWHKLPSVHLMNSFQHCSTQGLHVVVVVARPIVIQSMHDIVETYSIIQYAPNIALF